MKSLSHYVLLVLLASSAAFSALANASTLASQVNRNEVSTNETLTLTISIDEQVNTSELDLSSLRENFEILSNTPQSRSSFNIVNGNSEKTASTTWSVILVAKNEGILTIPSFTVRSASSRPISIKVNNAAQNKNSNLPLEVWVTTNTNEVFPNQQLIVEVELSAGSNVRDLNGPQLVIPGAEVEAFDQQNFQRVDNGIARQIVVLKYSVFASQAGELTIPIMTYTGLENGRRSVFGSTGTQVIARSKQLKVLVKEIPAVDGQPWFPADEVSISSSWSADISNLKVGEPITRTITVTAKGQQASAIPPVAHPSLDQGLKSYKDQAQLDTSKSTQGFVATRVESEAIVANRAGNFVIPELSVTWWNNNTKKWQTSTLEQQTLTVSGVAIPAEVQAQGSSGVINNANSFETNTVTKSSRLWQAISALLALIVLIQFYFIVRRPRIFSNELSNDDVTETEAASWAALQTAIKSDNSRAIRHKLLFWGRSALGTDTAVSLNTLASAANSEELSQLFEQLDQHLYRGGVKPDNSKIGSLLKQLRETLKQANKTKIQSKQPLKPLYPE